MKNKIFKNFWVAQAVIVTFLIFTVVSPVAPALADNQPIVNPPSPDSASALPTVQTPSTNPTATPTSPTGVTPPNSPQGVPSTGPSFTEPSPVTMVDNTPNGGPVVPSADTAILQQTFETSTDVGEISAGVPAGQTIMSTFSAPVGPQGVALSNLPGSLVIGDPEGVNSRIQNMRVEGNSLIIVTAGGSTYSLPLPSAGQSIGIFETYGPNSYTGFYMGSTAVWSLRNDGNGQISFLDRNGQVLFTMNVPVTLPVVPQPPPVVNQDPESPPVTPPVTPADNGAAALPAMGQGPEPPVVGPMPLREDPVDWEALGRETQQLREREFERQDFAAQLERERLAQLAQMDRDRQERLERERRQMQEALAALGGALQGLAGDVANRLIEEYQRAQAAAAAQAEAEAARQRAAAANPQGGPQPIIPIGGTTTQGGMIDLRNNPLEVRMVMGPGSIPVFITSIDASRAGQTWTFKLGITGNPIISEIEFSGELGAEIPLDLRTRDNDPRKDNRPIFARVTKIETETTINGRRVNVVEYRLRFYTKEVGSDGSTTETTVAAYNVGVEVRPVQSAALPANGDFGQNTNGTGNPSDNPIASLPPGNPNANGTPDTTWPVVAEGMPTFALGQLGQDAQNVTALNIPGQPSTFQTLVALPPGTGPTIQGAMNLVQTAMMNNPPVSASQPIAISPDTNLQEPVFTTLPNTDQSPPTVTLLPAIMDQPSGTPALHYGTNPNVQPLIALLPAQPPIAEPVTASLPAEPRPEPPRPVTLPNTDHSPQPVRAVLPSTFPSAEIAQAHPDYYHFSLNSQTILQGSPNEIASRPAVIIPKNSSAPEESLIALVHLSYQALMKEVMGNYYQRQFVTNNLGAYGLATMGWTEWTGNQNPLTVNDPRHHMTAAS